MSDLYTCKSIRTIEQQALALLPEGTLMSRAAVAIADQAELMLRDARITDDQQNPVQGSRQGSGQGSGEGSGQVLILAGAGNNGADALLSGLILAERGYRIAALCPPLTPGPGKAGAALNQNILNQYERQNIPLAPYSNILPALRCCRLVIDGLLGLGQSRPLEADLRALVSQLNSHRIPVLSVDVPTGLDASSGSILGGNAGVCIRAARTITLLRDKPGLHTGAGKEHAGLVIVNRLGCDEPNRADGELFDAGLAVAMLPRRALNSHKGSFGSVLIMGGAQGMQGAALLAATGAQAGGAGKVFISSPHQPVFVADQPQWMSRSWPPTMNDIDAVAIGCGLGKSEAARVALRLCLESDIPVVLDADALNMLADQVVDLSLLNRRSATVMTPHPLEAARLLGCSTAEIQADRCAMAVRLAQKFSSVVILKGAGSVIATPDGRWSINSTGAPTLAVAGTGDVLAGLIAALLAQGLSAWNSARLAAFTHGRAGELVQRRLPAGSGLAAAELLDPIRRALNGCELNSDQVPGS